MGDSVVINVAPLSSDNEDVFGRPRHSEEAVRVAATLRQVDPCHEEKRVGPSKAAIPRFFFDSESGSCSSFNYGGCRGNGNNFATQQDCEDKCVNSRRSGRQQTLTHALSLWTAGLAGPSNQGITTTMASVSSSSMEVAAAMQTTLQAWSLARRNVLQEGKEQQSRRQSANTGSRASTWVTLSNYQCSRGEAGGAGLACAALHLSSPAGRWLAP